MRYLWMIILCLVVCGCKTTAGGITPGTQLWYSTRMTQIDQSLADGKLTDQEHAKLKKDLDALRVHYEQTYPRDPWPPPSYWRGR